RVWRIALPVGAIAIGLAEGVVPASEIKLGEGNLTLLGRTGAGRMESGDWFKDRGDAKERGINIGTLLASGNVRDLVVYELDEDQKLTSLLFAKEGRFEDGQLILSQVSANGIAPGALMALADANSSTEPQAFVSTHETRTLQTSLT